MNRHERRLAAKLGVKANGQVQSPNQLVAAMQALQAVQSLQGNLGQLKQMEAQSQEAHDMIGNLVEDYQALADEQEALKATMLDLLGDQAKDLFAQHLERIRAQRQESAPATL